MNYSFECIQIALWRKKTTTKNCLSLHLGESQTGEDGRSEPNEHLPSSGSGSNAEDHQRGASEFDRPEAGHRWYYYNE